MERCEAVTVEPLTHGLAARKRVGKRLRGGGKVGIPFNPQFHHIFIEGGRQQTGCMVQEAPAQIMRQSVRGLKIAC